MEATYEYVKDLLELFNLLAGETAMGRVCGVKVVGLEFEAARVVSVRVRGGGARGGTEARPRRGPTDHVESC